MIRIDDPDDARIDHYRAVRDRDLAGRGGRFLAEGEVVLRALLGPRGRFQAESLLLSESRADSIAPTLASLAPSLPVYVAGQRVMDTIVGFHIHRGALGIGLRGPHKAASDLLSAVPDCALILCLVGLANHDNVGGAFRNAAAFGADGVLLDRTSCDPLYRKAIRVSVGASLQVPFAWAGSADEMIDALAGAGFETFALNPLRSALARSSKLAKAHGAACRGGGSGAPGTRPRAAPRAAHRHGAGLRFAQCGDRIRHCAPRRSAQRRGPFD